MMRGYILDAGWLGRHTHPPTFISGRLLLFPPAEDFLAARIIPLTKWVSSVIIEFRNKLKRDYSPLP